MNPYMVEALAKDRSSELRATHERRSRAPRRSHRATAAVRHRQAAGWWTIGEGRRVASPPRPAAG